MNSHFQPDSETIIQSGYALSPIQQRLWQLAQNDGLLTYLVSVEFHASGVNETALCHALTQIIKRHEILRMRFGLLPGMQLPVQVASAELAPDFEFSASGPQLAAINEDLRLSLQKLGDSHYRLGLSALCADATTLLLLMTELDQQLKNTAAAGIPEQELAFTSLAQWQHDMLAEQVEFKLPVWSEVTSLLPKAKLPDWPFIRQSLRHSAEHTGQTKSQAFIKRQALRVPAALSSELIKIAEEQRSRLDYLLYLAWSVLLFRLDSASPAVAWMANGRSYDEMATAMGPLARYLPAPIVLTEKSIFSHLLAEFGAQIEEIAALQDYLVPLAAGHQVAAGFNYLALPQNLQSLKFEAPFVWIERAHIILTGFCDSEQQLQLFFDYDMSSCEPAALIHLEEELLTLLAAIVQNPEQSIDRLNILGAAERDLILNRFAGPVVAGPACWRAPVAEIVLQLQAQPEHICISEPQRSWSRQAFLYRVLNLVRLINSQAMPPAKAESIVAVLLDRSADMIAGILAAQLSGAAYLPIDAAYPAERIAFMLVDSGARLLLTSTSIAQELRQHQEFTSIFEQLLVLELDLIPNDASPQIATTLASLCALQASDLAYLIYTSGSTGQPKAVAISHGALANHMRWMLREFPLTADDAILQKTAISFDASVWEIFAALMSQARLVLPAPGVERDPDAILAAVKEFDITVLQLVPSMLRMLITRPELAECRSLHRLFCGGEVLEPGLAQQVLKTLDAGAECINLYGPTEATVQVVFERVNRDDKQVAIGRPIDNTRIYILDACQQLQPIGVRGELYIAGAALAQGYYQRPELTAERFLPDPFTTPNDGDSKMYRSGDLAAWRSDGKLDCFGRIDRQVKLRGYRIELAEIENALNAQPEIAMAVAVIDRDAANIDQLLCFYTFKPTQTINQDQLKKKLAAHLPDYMLPNWLIAVDRFPYLPNGKLDHKTLLKLRPVHTAISQAPRDTIEMRLERIWESVLHITQVGVNNNFFDLGGHSLLAVRLMAEIEKEFGHRLPLTSLFAAPSIAAQAELLRHQELQLDTVLIPIRNGNPALSPIVLVHPTGGSVLCYRDLASALLTQRPVYALQDPGLSGRATYQSVPELASLYLDKITPLVKDQRYLLAGWSSGGIIAYEMARQVLARGNELALLCLIDSQVAPLASSAPAPERLLRSISRLIAHKADLVCPDLAGLSFEQALQSLLELARQADFVPPQADQAEIAILFEVFKKNVTVIGAYAPGKLPRRILLLKANQALPEHLREAAVHYRSDQTQLGWEQLCFVNLKEVPGDHMSIMEFPGITTLAAIINQELTEVERLHGLERQLLMPMLGL